MLTKQDVRRVIREAIEPTAAPHGFRAAGDRFKRKTSEGSQGFSIAIFDYRPNFEFTASVTVRLDLVEDFLAPFVGVAPAERSITVTSLTQLEHFGLVADPGRFVIYRGADLESVRASAAKLAGDLSTHVYPFLDRNQSLREVHAGLNPPGAESMTTPIFPDDRTRFDGSVEPYRAMRGITTAYLVGDPRLAALIQAYRGQLSGMVDEIRSRYEVLADHIQGLASS